MPSTWIIPVGRWLITMVSFLPLRIGFFPFPVAFPWLVNAGYPNHLLYNWDDPPSWAWSVWKVGWPTYCLPILCCHICPSTESWIITIARYDPYELGSVSIMNPLCTAQGQLVTALLACSSARLPSLVHAVRPANDRWLQRNPAATN